MVITCTRPIPAGRPWCRDKHCRVLPGLYETAGPRVREVYVPGQVGEIQGWSYCQWNGKTPTAVKLYVRVVTE